MKFHRTLLTATSLLALGATANTASANDGPYISGSVTATTLNHNINRNTGDMTNPSISTNVDDTGVGFRLGAGYKAHVSKRAYIAAEVFYTEESATTQSLNGMLMSTLDLKASYGVDGRIGYDVTDTVSLYALVGYTELKFDNDTGYTFAPPMNELSETESGITYGFGAEIGLSDRLSVIGEYRMTRDVDFSPNADVVGGFVNDNQINRDALRLGFNFSF